jgi:hypothetical protein
LRETDEVYHRIHFHIIEIFQIKEIIRKRVPGDNYSSLQIGLITLYSIPGLPDKLKYREYSGRCSVTYWHAHMFDIAQLGLSMYDAGPVILVIPHEKGLFVDLVCFCRWYRNGSQGL